METLGRVGVWSMELRGAGRPAVRDAAAELDQLGWRTIWLPGLDGAGVLDDVDHLLAAAPHSQVVTGVLNIWGQPAADLAPWAAARADRVLLGLGIGSPAGAAAHGQDYGSPVASMRHYLDRLGPGRQLLGALGPKMVDLAVTRTAGWHPFLVTPDYVSAYRGQVGPSPLIAPHQAVFLGTDVAEARAAARAGIGMFLGFPTYRANLKRLGFTDDDLVPGGSDRLIDALVAHGTADDIARRVREHLDAGADHVAVHVLGSAVPPLTQWRELAFLSKEN
ncbi:TIGR03620 family F420-dependent LLM class oxidoreductase [Actinoplanes sp. L3-i22]|uniref:TIGR03620 family F420-dependent LLM class oxidoreductase n=1 Tax=Actinoplanes sp. L3-i22 TaxID=2836373 RepID=UPI001C795F9E|nr:TIGR03620 family F420-dependent LLM class oxidoreductase [Actinoplanes sp. L3-i22]BCY08389.1 LLM class F420-dependent oxidoreductase [Actinoplanes sp. L3-i22]